MDYKKRNNFVIMKIKEESFWKFIAACLRTGNKEPAKKLIKQNKK